MEKTAVAILGSGNIGTDLMYKLKRSSLLRPVIMAGIVPDSEGLARARQEGLSTTSEGIDGLLKQKQNFVIVFDATTAAAHKKHAPLLRDEKKIAIDLTPAAVGPYVIPLVNLDEHIGETNLNLVSCGGQATVPLVSALEEVAPVEYAEIVATIASKSAGPGTRQNIDEFTDTTARGLEKIGHAARGKAIIVLNPAEPPILMRNTIHAVLADADAAKILHALESMVERVKQYVPGYRLRAKPLIQDQPNGGRKKKVTLFVEIEGAGDFLPKYAGNLDIMTSAAVKVGEEIGRHLGMGTWQKESSGGDKVSEKTFVHILDSSLRDGSHALSHQYTAEQVSRVAGALDDAGVEMIEVSHGDGLGGSTITYGFSKQSELELLEAAAAVIKKGKLAVLLLPGIGTKDDLKMAADYGAKVAQIATHVTEADIAEQHIGVAKKMGMEVIGMLMLSHMGSPETIAEQGKLMESFGADVVLVTDSAGALMPETVRQRVAALRAALKIGVGFHGHNNLSLAVANSVAAIEEGARWIDACTCGLGAGSGNTPTEVLAAVLDKMGYETGINLWKIMDVAENIVRPIMPKPVRIGKVSLTMGYAGVYSSFLLHADKAAEQFGVDARDILVELGKRKVVGGQEDMIVEVAMMLAEKQKQNATA